MIASSLPANATFLGQAWLLNRGLRRDQSGHFEREISEE